MQKVIDEDLLAFEVIYMRYKKPVYTYLFYKLGNDLVEEVFQDIFLKLLEKKQSFKFESKFKTWFWTMIKNTITDIYRSKDFQNAKLTEELYNEEGEEILEDPLDFVDAINFKLQSKNILECFENLKNEQKMALSLNLHSELTYEEIADQMNLKVGAIKTIIHRGKKAWALCLQARGVK